MLILLLIRRLGPRGRTIAGAVLFGLGAVVIGVSAALSVDLYVHGVILIALGAMIWAGVLIGKRRGPAGDQAAGRDLVASTAPAGTMEDMARRAGR